MAGSAKRFSLNTLEQPWICSAKPLKISAEITYSITPDNPQHPLIATETVTTSSSVAVYEMATTTTTTTTMTKTETFLAYWRKSARRLLLVHLADWHSTTTYTRAVAGTFITRRRQHPSQTSHLQCTRSWNITTLAIYKLLSITNVTTLSEQSHSQKDRTVSAL